MLERFGQESTDAYQRLSKNPHVGRALTDLLQTPADFERLRQLRQGYNREIREQLGPLVGTLPATRANAARVHDVRRKIGARYKDLTPSQYRTNLYAWNVERYGDELGPSLDSLIEKYKHDLRMSETEAYHTVIANGVETNRDLDRFFGVKE